MKSYEDEDGYWYPDVSMIGSLYSISDQVPEEPKRSLWQKIRRKPQPQEEPKPTFGFSRILDDDSY